MIALFKFIGRNFLYIALMVLGIFIGGYLIGAGNDIRNFLFPQSAAYVIPSQTIVTSIKNIGQLVTVTSEIGTTDVKVEIHQGFLNAGYYSASHIAVGAIEAGIDFVKINEDSISFQDDEYILTLPPSTVTSCRIEHIDQNQHSFTLLSADWDMVRQLAHHDAITQFAREMIQADILDRAERQAELLIAEFVRDLTGKPTSIKFAARDGMPELPQSCRPHTPRGWVKDVDGAWKRSN